jgi:hypothetical protein
MASSALGRERGGAVRCVPLARDVEKIRDDAMAMLRENALGVKLHAMHREGAMREAFAMKDRLVFMDFITDQTENVFPMVPGGKGLTEMILAEEL